MAACSEQQIDGNVVTDFHSKFPVSAANIQNSEVPVKILKTNERISTQKVSNTGVEEPDFSSLREEELKNLLEDLISPRPKESSLLAQRLLDGVREPDDSVPHGAPGKAFGTIRGPARRRTAISCHRSLQDLPALQHDAMRSAGLGRSRPPGGGRTVRAHSLSDHQDFEGGSEVAIEMLPLTRKSVESVPRQSDDNPERTTAKNGMVAPQEEKGAEEDSRSKSCSLVLTKLFPFPLQSMEPLERTKTFLCGSDTTRSSNCQDSHNSHITFRKGKKARVVENKLLAKNMEGNCGDLPIERLLEFICSGDKQHSKTSNSLGAKAKNTRKLLPKVANNGSRNKEDMTQDLVNNNFVDERSSLVGSGEKEESPTLPSGDTPERSLSPSFYSDQGIDCDGSYRVDVSSFSDVDHVHEECEFRVVTKKHRRKMQPKKVVENFRPYYQPPFKKKSASEMPSQTSETVRRKSAGSAPPSEQSSPENSDLDSVHSLPVRRATTLQTSYADIAKMCCGRRAAEDVVLANGRPASQASVGDDLKKTPAVVILDGEEGLTSALGEITFGFDVNEQLLRMTLDDVFVPSMGTPKMVPHFEDHSDDIGRFNYRDVVDFLDCAWNRAYQTYERDLASGEKKGCLYYCDGQHS